MISNFSLRQRLNLYLKEKFFADLTYDLKEFVIHIQLSIILDVKAIKIFRFDIFN